MTRIPIGKDPEGAEARLAPSTIDIRSIGKRIPLTLVISTRVPVPFKRRLEAYARAFGISLREAQRRLLDEALTAHEEGGPRGKDFGCDN